jgi:3-methyladenine DNA glycosylase AlkD
MRHQFPFLGIAAPRLDSLLRGLPWPGPEEVLEVAAACWKLPEREYQYGGVRYLVRAARGLPADCLPQIERLITTRSWWDTVDELATHVVGSLVLSHPDLVADMDRWLESENLWLARSAILHQERWKERTDADRLFRYCLRRSGDRDFFIRKAIGWALRSYAATDPLAVAGFLEEQGSTLSGLSQREARRGVERRLRQWARARG